MSEDRALLEKMPIIQEVVFRHYGWDQEFVTFGYSQKFKDVIKTCGVDHSLLMRRPTGGGIVWHDLDWTYTLLIPTRDPLFHNPRAFYELSHTLILEALEKSGAGELHLAPCPRACGIVPKKIEVSQCFIQPELNDVMVDGDQKVAGAAIKKSKQGVLLQGSISKKPLQNIDWKIFHTHFILALSKHFKSKALPFSYKEIDHFEDEKNLWYQKMSEVEWNTCR